ncbi:hypothetical protein AV530_017084 [Patagioenas fasciata monilis]|uniref:Uncharacterized protein n=1 Tax=Patagioenas fasciata monilis TaxID=372326 RepID=A0A1V4J4V1_PATFA|nr:hypothetical protein AV530_017084 [Patagioenas fasciata monilis]
MMSPQLLFSESFLRSEDEGEYTFRNKKRTCKHLLASIRRNPGSTEDDSLQQLQDPTLHNAYYQELLKHLQWTSPSEHRASSEYLQLHIFLWIHGSV